MVDVKKKMNEINENEIICFGKYKGKSYQEFFQDSQSENYFNWCKK